MLLAGEEELRVIRGQDLGEDRRDHQQQQDQQSGHRELVAKDAPPEGGLAGQGLYFGIEDRRGGLGFVGDAHESRILGLA